MADRYLIDLIQRLQALPEDAQVLQLQEDKRRAGHSHYLSIQIEIHIPNSVVSGEVLGRELESGKHGSG